jgi:hypothetical protein
MPSSSQSDSSLTPLSAFASFVGVMSLFLYYSGWIYRWAYFDSFAIDIRSLNFSTESFIFVTIQVFLGSLDKFVLLVAMGFVDLLIIKLVLWFLGDGTSKDRRRSTIARELEIIHGIFKPTRWITKIIHGIFESIVWITEIIHGVFKPIRWIAKIIPSNLLKELITVAFILVFLFFFARYQGMIDASRDAVDATSTRPTITIVGSATKLPIGRKIDDISAVPIPKEINIIGGKEELENIKDIDINYHNSDKKESNNPDINTQRTWRLLAENANWVYIFPSQNINQPGAFPSVVAINTGEGRVQVLILNHAEDKTVKK